MFHVSRDVIFSADDFGQSALANKNILRLVRAGKIQRVSVMAEGKFTKEEVKELLHSKVKLDVHLTLPLTTGNWELAIGNWGQEKRNETTNHPSYQPSTINPPSPVTNDQLLVTNTISRLFNFFRLYFSGHIRSRKIIISWSSQIEKFQKIFGSWPDGLNSHENTHFFPPYFKIALKLCQKYKIRHLRFGSKGILTSQNLIGWILKVLNNINRKSFTSYQLLVTSYSFLTSSDWIKDKNKFLKNLPAGTVEIVLHPERKG